MSKLGRNDPCPCGSGKKYKKCCANQALSAVVQRFQQHYQAGLEAHQQQTHREMLQAMKANGMDPAYVYAAEKTGVMLFQETMHLLPPEDVERFERAYEEFSKSGPDT